MPPRFVLDTDTAVEFLRGNQRVRHRVLSKPAEELAIPFVVAAELFYGAHRAPRPESRFALLESFLQNIPILHSTREVVEIYARVKAELAAAGRLLEDNDLFVAASALAAKAILVTGNTRHFDRVSGLELQNWIERPEPAKKSTGPLP